jgi:hypothetical protein
VLDEHMRPVDWTSHGQVPIQRVWFSHIQQKFHTHAGKDHVDFPIGTWYYTPRRLKANPRITEVKTRVLYLPFGWPGNESSDIDNREEVGQLMGQNAIALAQAWRPKLIAAGFPEDDVNLWAREAEIDISQLRVKVYGTVHIFTARVEA